MHVLLPCLAAPAWTACSSYCLWPLATDRKWRGFCMGTTEVLWRPHVDEFHFHKLGYQQFQHCKLEQILAVLVL